MFCLLCGDQTEDAYSKIGSIRVENAMDLALLEQPSMVQRRTLKDLVAFDATDIHLSFIT